MMLPDLRQQRVSDRLPVIALDDHVIASQRCLKLSHTIRQFRSRKQPKTLTRIQFKVILGRFVGHRPPQSAPSRTKTRRRFQQVSHEIIPFISARPAAPWVRRLRPVLA